MSSLRVEPPANLTLARGDPDYPAVLEDLEAPPDPLFVRGPLDLSGPRVAIVGTRRASARGRDLAERLGFTLGRRGVTVISGGALGIDGAAHRGAVRAGAPTWVVLPSPLTAPAPPRNRGLFDDVLDAGGAWLSETTGPMGKLAFFARNRIVAALAHVVVVVEAKRRSGTRHTVRAAQALERTIGAFPWGVGEDYGAGCLDTLKEGGHLITEAEDVIELLQGLGQAPSRLLPPVMATAGGPVLAALGTEAVRPEVLATRLGWPVGRVLSELTALELRGQVRAEPGGLMRAVLG